MNKITILLILFLYTSQGFAQSGAQILTGKIFSEANSKPLENVSIRNLTTNNTAKTDTGGLFKITGRTLDDRLRISIVGHRDTILLARFFSETPIYYIPLDNNEIQEVLVETGYQTLRPNETTGAVDVITNEMLNQQTGLDILQRLNNIAPAIRFDSQRSAGSAELQKLNMSVRGLSTINGHLDPLVVLDGFIYEGNIANIDPNSIETVTILKDAAASSIWGARAGNGVIVMTSKKGKFADQQPTKVSFNSTLITKQKPDLESIYQLSNPDFIQIEKMLFDRGYYTSQLNNSPFIATTPAIDIFDQRKRGQITAADSAARMETLLAQDGRRSYMDNFYQVPLSQQYSVNISGGSRYNSYGLGLGYTGNSTELDAQMDKINIQLNNSFRPTDRLQLDVSLMFTNQSDQSGRPEYSSLTHNVKRVPYNNFRDEDGNEMPFEKEFRQRHLDNNLTSGYLDWRYYPLSEYQHANVSNRLNEWYANTALRYKIFSFLDANVGFQYQNQRIENIGLDGAESHAARSLINQFTEINPTTGAIKHNIPLGGIRRMGNAMGSSYTLRGQSNLNKDIGLLKLIGMVGGEMRENKNQGSSYTSYGYQDDPLSSTAVDFVTRFRTMPRNSLRNIAGAPLFTQTANRFISLYSNWSAIWDKKYTISGSFRRDGANIFGATTNDKWSPLWSIGGSWELTNESFFNVENVERLRLRSTYGYSGNLDLRKTPDPIGYTGVGQYINVPALTISELNDPSLRWERIGTFNMGLDLSLFKGRIEGTVDYYIKNGRDLYGLTEYDYTAWGTQPSITKNVAGMQSKGWDIAINTINTNGLVRWSSRAIVSFNRNVTTEYYQTANSGILTFLGHGTTIQPYVGRPLNGISAYRYFGLNEQGQALGILDGELTTDYAAIRRAVFDSPDGHESIEFIGSSKPQAFGNLINTIDWKSLTFSFNVSYRANYYFQRPSTSYSSLYQNGIGFPDFERRWQQSGDENKTNVPALVYPLPSNSVAFYNNANIHVFDASHIRLEYVSLAWRHQVNLVNRKTSFQLYGNVSNLGLLWTANKDKVDPDYSYRLAPPTTYSIGLRMDY